MWITPLGKRILENKEKNLFMAAASTGIDILSEIANDNYSPMPDGNRWDNLYWHQQICAIGEVSKNMIGMSKVEIPPCEWSELTINSIYDFIIYTNSQEFEDVIVDAAREANIKIKNVGENSASKLDSILRQMKSRIVGKQTKKQKIEKFGESYYTEPFPAFSMDRFMQTYEMFNKEYSFGMAQLSKVIQNRFALGFEENNKTNYKPWYPIYNKKEIRFCWK